MYSFGVVLLEAITGRYPVDYGRPQSEVCYTHLFFQMSVEIRSAMSTALVDE